jgi:hypothetical protein
MARAGFLDIIMSGFLNEKHNRSMPGSGVQRDIMYQLALCWHSISMTPPS